MFLWYVISYVFDASICGEMYLMNQTKCQYLGHVYMPLMFVILGYYINGLVQNCSNSITNILELLQSCTKPSICSDFAIDMVNAILFCGD